MFRFGEQSNPKQVLVWLGLFCLSICLAFLLYDAGGDLSFILAFRGTKLAAMLLTSYAIAVSTMLFQTITGNRILTPSIMGFDALFGLIQTTSIFVFGSHSLNQMDGRLIFIGNAAVMVLFACTLYRWLFTKKVTNLHVLLLVGVISGLLFRSSAGFLQRVMDPNEYTILQDRLFANFNSLDVHNVELSSAMIAIASLFLWRLFSVFDVLALGRTTSLSLGVDHLRVTTYILVLIAIFVSVATALAGPMTFFGLVVANISYQLVPTSKHRFLLPAATFVGVATLVGGQMVVERVFGFNAAVGVVIEFVGGLAFLVMVVSGRAA